MKRILLAIVFILSLVSPVASADYYGGTATDEVGTLTNGKWCTSDGSVINCTQEAPAGSGDVIGPASSTQYKIPIWGSDSKTLIDGVAVGTAGQLLRSAGAGANPAWSAYTLALPGDAGAVLYSDGTNWTRSTAPSLLALTLYGQSAGGGAQLSLGSSSGSTDPNNGKMNFRNSTNGYLFSVTSGVTGADIGWTLPTAAPGGANYLLNVDADGTMGYTDPASIGGGTGDVTDVGSCTTGNCSSFTVGGIALGDTTPDADGEIGYASNAFLGFANSEDFTLTASANMWTLNSNTSAAFTITPALTVTDAATLNGGFSAVGTNTVSNGSSSAGSIYFKEDSDNGTNTAQLIGPASTADVVITLPATTGTVALTGTVQLTAAPGSDHTYSGTVATMTAGENLTIGQLCYRKSDGKWWLADADAATTMPGLAMATDSISADATGVFLLSGFLRDDTFDWTVGGLVYAGSGATSTHTAGAINQAAPNGSGDQVQIIGYAYTADILYFNPSMLMLEL